MYTHWKEQGILENSENTACVLARVTLVKVALFTREEI